MNPNAVRKLSIEELHEARKCLTGRDVSQLSKTQQNKHRLLLRRVNRTLKNRLDPKDDSRLKRLIIAIAANEIGIDAITMGAEELDDRFEDCVGAANSILETWIEYDKD